MDAFAEKLAFAMKALSLSRGGLGVELAVDKSVVSRWLSGARTPTSTNLAALTAVVARRAPEFTMLDWDRSIGQLATRLGIAAADPAAEHAPAQTSANIQGWLSLPKFREAAQNSSGYAEATKGFWRAIAPMPGMPDKFGQSFSMFSAADDGTMRIETGFFSMRRIGWSVAVGHQFFSCITGIDDGYLAFTIVNRPQTQIVDVMDGIFLGCLADNGGVPIAMPIVMERIEDLSGDADADALRLTDLLMRDPIVADTTVHEAIRRRLAASVVANGAEGPAQPLLMMAALSSLARGRRDRP